MVLNSILKAINGIKWFNCNYITLLTGSSLYSMTLISQVMRSFVGVPTSWPLYAIRPYLCGALRKGFNAVKDFVCFWLTWSQNLDAVFTVRACNDLWLGAKVQFIHGFSKLSHKVKPSSPTARKLVKISKENAFSERKSPSSLGKT